MQQPLHRAVAHVDLDAFYAQVEVKQHPALHGKPVGVVQYNPYGDLKTCAPDEDRVMNSSNGSLIAVSYEARAQGVKRNMRGDQARAACPEIQLVQVPTAHGKADLTLYRSEGKRVLDILARLAKAERASIDECFLDLTEEAQRRLEACGGVPQLPCNPDQVHVMTEGGFSAAPAWWQRPPEQWQAGERLLACAAAAVAELREAVRQELGFTCSAGVAHTKLMAKLCSGLHKPAQQTVLPAAAVPVLLAPLPIPKLRGLGGRFGEQVMSELGIEAVGELAATPLPRLESVFGEKDAQWLAGLARGVSDDAVEERKLAKSVSCGKTFRGRQALRDLAAVHSWLLELGGELSERLEADREDNSRIPQLLTVSFASQLPWMAAPGGGFQAPPGYHSTSRSCPLRKLTAEGMADDALALVRRWASEHGSGWSIASLYVSAGNFVPVQSASSAITRFFKPAAVQKGEREQEMGAECGIAGTAAEAEAGEQQEQLHTEEQQQQQQQQQEPQQQHQGCQLEQVTPSAFKGAAAQAAGWQQQVAQARQPEADIGRSRAGTAAVPAGPAAEPAAGAAGAAGVDPDQAGRYCAAGVDPDQAGPSGSRPWHTLQRAVQPPPPPPQQQQQHQQQQHPQQQHHGSSSGAQQHHGSSSGAQQQQPSSSALNNAGVDEAVLAELPAELQREIRAQLKMEQMSRRLQGSRRASSSASAVGNAGGSGSSKRPGSAGGSGGEGAGKRGGTAAGTQRIDVFLKGKRPKR